MAAPWAVAGPIEPGSGEWNYTVRLDGKTIGSHRFVLAADDGVEDRTLTSTADFQVRILGFTAYRYRHRDTERWRGDCLRSLSASTDDDGNETDVRAEPSGERLDIRVVARGRDAARVPASTTVGGCLMSFAYWNPALRAQTRLLNPQTGRIEQVAFSPLGTRAIDVHGRAVTATGWRIGGLAEPIDVWYDADGAWIGLDTVVGGHRRLTYRLP